jgi:hypothetical protein
LNETFGFAIGARGVGAGKVMAQAQLHPGSVESMGTVTVTVIGQQAANGNAQAGVISHCGTQESDSASSVKVGQNLCESNTGVVIDGDMKVFPATMQLTAAAAIGTRNHAGEASQLLNIEVQQIARSGMFIANQRYSRFQIPHAVQAEPAENTAHGSAAQAGGLGYMKAGEALSPQLFDALRQRFPGATRGTMGPRGAII